MPKRPLKLKIRIPPYTTPRNAWRRRLHERVAEKQRTSTVTYPATDRLEIEALIYMPGPALRKHDVDNRIKDISMHRRVARAVQSRVARSCRSFRTTA